MKISLHNTDRTAFPNLALLKLSAWYKARGDEVSAYHPMFDYDLVYSSKVFTWSAEDRYLPSDNVVKGGTGYGILGFLHDEIEHTCPDYTGMDYSLGFLTRGCRPARDVRIYQAALRCDMAVSQDDVLGCDTAQQGGGGAVRYLSVCSGIEAATVAWGPLGWKAIAFAEIDKFPSAVLAHHYPDVPNLGDFTKIQGSDYRATVDLIVGGTPCQDFSVAGKRAGMAGERGGLALAFINLVRDVSPRWVVWENVPGVLSSGNGRDFGAFVGKLAELGYGVCWRVLDAQYFGVPQRRRRVFLVGYLGDWRPAAAVLFEPHSLRRDPPPSREAREGIAGAITSSFGKRGRAGSPDSAASGYLQLAGTLGGVSGTRGWSVNAEQAASGHLQITQALTGRLGGGGPDDNKAQGGFYVPEIIGQTMSCKWSKGTSGPAGDEHHNLVAAPLRAEGFDASEDGTGRQNLVAVPINTQVSIVRRLTPKECERLQGFPDDYTLIPYRGKPASDGPRYKALGNSFAVPVIEWIGGRIDGFKSAGVA